MNLDRLYALDALVREGRYSYAELVDRLLEQGFGGRGGEQPISERTFRLDLAELTRRRCADQTALRVTTREVKGADDQRRWEYCYETEDGSVPPPLCQDFLFTEEQREALTLGLLAVEQFLELPEARELRHILGIGEEDEIYNSPVWFNGSPYRMIDAALWLELKEAIRTSHVVRITYQRGWGHREDRTLDVAPLGLSFLESEWYLLANAGTAREPEIRQYHVNRIRSVRTLRRQWDRKLRRLLPAYVENVFGRFIGDPDALEEVCVRFDAEIAPGVAHRVFHRNERRRELPDGGLEVSFPVTRAAASDAWEFFHVRQWILSFAGKCEVLSPPRLRDLIREDVRSLSNMVDRRDG